MDKHGSNILHYAAQNSNSCETLEFFLENGMGDLKDSRNAYGTTPLHLAAQFGTLDNVK